MSTAPMNKIANSVRVKVRVARKSSDLKVGYFTSLTIIQERNNMSAGSTTRHEPLVNSFPCHQIMKYVSEHTNPAAEGMGKPRNSLPPPEPAIAARQLNRASRKAPQMT